MRSFSQGSRRYVFAGPTAVGLDLPTGSQAGFRVLPPAQRGDIEKLCVRGESGVIVLVDGRFDQRLSVGHAELRTAIDRGWVVWGLSSMGAIRAYEMRNHGMRGFGKVYEHFLGDEDFQDDEVSLLHMPRPNYGAVSEPLVHLRYLLLEMESEGILDRPTAQSVVDDLKGAWYGYRTIESALATITYHATPSAARVAKAKWSSSPARYRVKSRDLQTFLDRRVWQVKDYAPKPAPAPYSRTPLRVGVRV